MSGPAPGHTARTWGVFCNRIPYFKALGEASPRNPHTLCSASCSRHTHTPRVGEQLLLLGNRQARPVDTAWCECPISQSCGVAVQLVHCRNLYFPGAENRRVGFPGRPTEYRSYPRAAAASGLLCCALSFQPATLPPWPSEGPFLPLCLSPGPLP